MLQPYRGMVLHADVILVCVRVFFFYFFFASPMWAKEGETHVLNTPRPRSRGNPPVESCFRVKITAPPLSNIMTAFLRPLGQVLVSQ